MERPLQLEGLVVSSVIPEGLCRRLEGEIESLVTHGRNAGLPENVYSAAKENDDTGIEVLRLGSIDTASEPAMRLPSVVNTFFKLLLAREVLEQHDIPNACVVGRIPPDKRWKYDLKGGVPGVPILVVPLKMAIVVTDDDEGDTTTTSTSVATGSVMQLTKRSNKSATNTISVSILDTSAESICMLLFQTKSMTPATTTDMPQVEEVSLSEYPHESKKQRTKRLKQVEKAEKKERQLLARQLEREKNNVTKSVVPYGMFKSIPIPWQVVADSEAAQKDILVTPPLELEHVKNLYNAIAPHWHGTRYKAWPRVSQFIRSQHKHSLMGDIGCGNGKNIPACSEVGNVIGCDLSVELIKICRGMGFEVGVADIMSLPFRAETFDAVIFIAVMHHISSERRRIRALSELMRTVVVGGQGLVYAWAFEQEGSKSGHKFEQQDVFVPWHLQEKTDPLASKHSNQNSKNSNHDRENSHCSASSADLLKSGSLSAANSTQNNKHTHTHGYEKSDSLISSEVVINHSTAHRSQCNTDDDDDACMFTKKHTDTDNNANNNNTTNNSNTTTTTNNNTTTNTNNNNTTNNNTNNTTTTTTTTTISKHSHNNSTRHQDITVPTTNTTTTTSTTTPPSTSTTTATTPHASSDSEVSPQTKTANIEKSDATIETETSVPLEEDLIFQRYCHVYKGGELEALINNHLPWLKVEESYYDTGNWAIVIRKIASTPAIDDVTNANEHT